jgi:hypothetical protein
MNYQDMSPIIDDYDKIRTIFGCLAELNKSYLASLILRNRNYNKLERYARFVKALAVKQNRKNLIDELQFSGLIYG